MKEETSVQHISLGIKRQKCLYNSAYTICVSSVFVPQSPLTSSSTKAALFKFLANRSFIKKIAINNHLYLQHFGKNLTTS